jgi:hypothetical protein
LQKRQFSQKPIFAKTLIFAYNYFISQKL